MSCGPSGESTSSDAAKQEMVEADTFPTMTPAQALYLYENADKVDVLFSDISVSLSQVKQSDVQGQISFFKPGQVPKKMSCSESANIILQSKGDIIGDGHMFLRGKCNYVVFYEDGKPAYATQMTDQGMKFYRQIMAAGVPTVTQ